MVGWSDVSSRLRFLMHNHVGHTHPRMNHVSLHCPHRHKGRSSQSPLLIMTGKNCVECFEAAVTLYKPRATEDVETLVIY